MTAEEPTRADHRSANTARGAFVSARGERDATAFAALDGEQLAEIEAFGVERPMSAGETLFEAGDASSDLFVVLAGRAEVVRPNSDEPVVIASYGRGGFAGELNLLTGQRRYLSCRVIEDGRVLVVGEPEFRRLMSARPGLADTIFNALLARRQILLEGPGAEAIRVVGSRFSPAAMGLRSFAEHSRIPYTWIDVEDDEDPDRLLAGLQLSSDELPAVITPTETILRATPGEFAARVGLTFQPKPGYIFDLVVVGSGPAGLAASVYGASEGLRTVCLDLLAIGGQAGTSSRIENYAGFPNGISGGDLTARTAAQAMRLGARLNAPCEVVALRREPSFHVVALGDGSEIPTQAVIIASGAQYRRLPVEGLERFENAGVYYAATNLEARVCAGTPVTVVGGGNSAGQAAIYLAQNRCQVTLAVRRSGLEETMSAYLIERIDADPGIELLTCVEVSGLEGDEHLEEVALRELEGGAERALPCAGLFSFIGAAPATGWLDGSVSLDEDGFILTDRQLADHRSGVTGALPFETSLPGVFAAGDVRHGSMKRVAAAVGEGSSAVRSVHERLATPR
jgi:thioredoxin reductase (NADPH)